MIKYANGIAEGHKQICELCGAGAWRTIMHRRKKRPGFNSLFHRNYSNGKPFLIVAEYLFYRNSSPEIKRGRPKTETATENKTDDALGL